jgi:carboxyl-terminal processing protease
VRLSASRAARTPSSTRRCAAVGEGQGRGIVFDLRGNGGGLVSEARLVASAFLERGRDRDDARALGRRAGLPRDRRPGGADTPLVVLVDRDSASASEIVAGALQDRDRAKLVGTRTFGKGVFQAVFPLDNGGALDITVGQYFLPSGRNLGGKGTARGAGLEPDVEARDDPKTAAPRRGARAGVRRARGP